MVRSSQERSSQVRSSQDRSSQDTSSQDRSSQDWSSQDWSSQDMSNQDKFIQDRSSYDRPFQVRSSKERSSQVRSSQDHLHQQEVDTLVVLQRAGYPPPKKQASVIWRLGDERGQDMSKRYLRSDFRLEVYTKSTINQIAHTPYSFFFMIYYCGKGISVLNHASFKWRQGYD